MLLRCVFAVLATLLSVGMSDNRSGEKRKKADGEVQPGMVASRVEDLLGKPDRISRQVLFRRHVEQWTYLEPRALRLELQGVRGQEAQVVSVHPLRSKKR